jgi:integrase
VADLIPEVVENYMAGLRPKMKPISVHRHFRVLRTFSLWLARTGRLSADPMAGLVMRAPKTLPRVPDAEDVRRLLQACDTSFEGQRNRAVIMLLADSGLRREEARRLRVGDVDLTTRFIRVTQGKGQRDGTGFFGEATASALRAWLGLHPDPRPAAPSSSPGMESSSPPGPSRTSSTASPGAPGWSGQLARTRCGTSRRRSCCGARPTRTVKPPGSSGASGSGTLSTGPCGRRRSGKGSISPAS